MCVYRYKHIQIITIQRIIPLGLLLCKNSSFLFSIANFSNSDCSVPSLLKKIASHNLSIWAMLQRQSSSMLEGYLLHPFVCWCSQVRFPLKNSGCHTTKSLLLHLLKWEWTAIDANLPEVKLRKMLLHCERFAMQMLAVWFRCLRKVSRVVIGALWYQRHPHRTGKHHPQDSNFWTAWRNSDRMP